MKTYYEKASCIVQNENDHRPKTKQTFKAAPKNDVTARVMPNAVDNS